MQTETLSPSHSCYPHKKNFVYFFTLLKPSPAVDVNIDMPKTVLCLFNVPNFVFLIDLIIFVNFKEIEFIELLSKKFHNE